MNFDIEEHKLLANGQVDPDTDTDMALNKQKTLLLGKTRQTQKHSNWRQKPEQTKNQNLTRKRGQTRNVQKDEGVHGITNTK